MYFSQSGGTIMLWAARQGSQFDGGCSQNMAEREGFEPPIPVKVCPLSRRIVSTTHAPLRKQSLAVGPWSLGFHPRCWPTTNGQGPPAILYHRLLKKACNISA